MWAGPGQDPENPLGVGGLRLNQWVHATRTGRAPLFDHLGGTAAGYECVELVSSPSVGHVRPA
jgi:hypothetical protein